MIRMSQIRVVQVMINLGAEIFINSKNKVKYIDGTDDPINTPMFRIAHKIGNKDMLKVIMMHKFQQNQQGINQ